LDLGCGSGGFGRRFLDRGYDVTFADARKSNLSKVKTFYKGAKTRVCNVEIDSVQKLGNYDLILCMGLIYHLQDPYKLFKQLSKMSRNVFVESTCLDHDGYQIIFLNESTDPAQFSATGNACRPSPGWVEENLFRSGFRVVKDVSCGSGNQKPGRGFSGKVFDWNFKRTCGWRRNDCVLRKLFLAQK
jgi:SAM-dependent methyltransferase